MIELPIKLAGLSSRNQTVQGRFIIFELFCRCLFFTSLGQIIVRLACQETGPSGISVRIARACRVKFRQKVLSGLRSVTFHRPLVEFGAKIPYQS